MKEKILKVLKNENRAYSAIEISDILNFNKTEELEEVLKALEELVQELKVYHTKKDRYILFNNSHLKVGTLMGNKKGYGFVDVDGDEDVFIPFTNMNGAIHGDKVIVEIVSKSNLGLEGRVIKVVDRKLKQFVGEIYSFKGKLCLKLDEQKVKLNIDIDKDKTLGAVEGHKVLVRLIGQNKDIYRGAVIKILGHKNDPGVDILSIASKYDINDEFSEDVMNEIDNIPSFVSEEEKIDRKDLRNECIFTIDGDDTKDIDDAISIEKLDNDNYKLGVHIADVSYYVKEDMVLDKEAYERGTSVYLADRVIPMLPHKLSNGICSLNPNEDRLAISCVMEIDSNGNVVNYDIFESVIKSKIQMTYKKVNKLLEENIVVEGYEPYQEKLLQMKELAKVLRDSKIKRGYIDFGVDEAKIIVNEKGEAIDVIKRYRGIGENLIEDFMIVANETVATHIYNMDLPFIYRVHGEPSEEKIQSFLQFISILGYKVNGKIKDIHPKTMQKILGQLEDKKEYHLLSSLLLRSMQKAVYDYKNIGHFGLASKCYTHFTSPIRRYPDTTVHRLLRTYLFKGKVNVETTSYWEQKLPFLTEHTSLKERNSIECEREIDDMKMAEYMEKHIGEEYTGMISGVTSFGLFVELDNLVEGLIHIDSLNDKYIYDEATFTLRSNKNKRGYRLGDIVKVRVIAASKQAKTIDFELVTEGEDDGNIKQES